MYEKPFYRIYRPNKLKDYDYILEDEYCTERVDLIKYYNFLQKQVVEIFDYIYPCQKNMNTFSSKNYQILGNICMEVENNFKGIICANSYNKTVQTLNMNDYNKLNKYLKLSDYELSLRFSKDIIRFRPFKNFLDENKKIEWYQSYNSSKHNRTKDIDKATLENVLNALGGLNILLRAQFYCYYDIINNNNTLLSYLQLQNGVFNSQNSLSIFEIINEPNWKDYEKYNFEWKELKECNERFCKFDIV